MSFSISWLNERYRFDEAARNEVIELSCIHHFAYPTHLRIVDVGSGTGSNVRYYLDRIPQDQTWICVEQDPELCQALPGVVADHARSQGYEAVFEGELLRLQGAGHVVTVEVRQGSLLDLEQVLDLSAVDLVTANAVFDLFSREQFAHFAGQLSRHGVSLLATLNYTGMKFYPEDPGDDQVIGWYEAHMEREQEFGRGMGKNGPAGMEEILKKGGAHVETGDSLWEIRGKDKEMLGYLLGFMEGAIGELPLSQEEKDLFEQWLDRKKALLIQGGCELEVQHEDIWMRGA